MKNNAGHADAVGRLVVCCHPINAGTGCQRYIGYALEAVCPLLYPRREELASCATAGEVWWSGRADAAATVVAAELRILVPAMDTCLHG